MVPRFLARLSPSGNAPLGARAWRGTTLRLPENSPSQWTNILTGETLRPDENQELLVGNILRKFPVAVLHGVAEGAAEELEAIATVAEEPQKVLIS